MLSVNDLIDISYIPEETDISLELLVDFFEQHFMKHIYKFTLENDEEVKLIFSNVSELFHLLGAHHIYEESGFSMNNVQFIQEIKNNHLSFADLQNVNSNRYSDYILRMRSFACVNSLLKRCDCLFFPDGKIPSSEIGAKYLLLRHFNDVNLHLGINTYKEGRPFFAKTLLPTDGAVKEKYIERAKEKFSVKKLEIIERKTDRIIETIDREKAIQIAHSDVWKLAENWINTKVSDAKEKGVLENLKGRELKKELETHLRSHKSTLEANVMHHDPYLTGKIVLDAIHGYLKDDFPDRLLSYIEKFKSITKEKPFYTMQSLPKDLQEKKAREAAQPPVKPVPGINKPKRDGIDD